MYTHLSPSFTQVYGHAKKLRQGDITIQTSIDQVMSFGAIPCVRNNN